MVPKRSYGEIWLSAVVALGAFLISTYFALFENVFEFAKRHQAWHELDTGFALLICAGAWLFFISIRRNRQLQHEIKKREAAENRAYASARHDSLTGLPNRLFFTETIAEAVAEMVSGNLRYVVLFIDLDRFKPVNDTFGHCIGDAVLTEVAKRLRIALPEAKQIARLGGDEFGILLALSSGEDVPPSGAIERIHQAFGEPISIDHVNVRLGVTIGSAVAAGPECRAEDLIRAADFAMYDRKRHQSIREHQAA
jgi:diguanylate cyclase (GGDEF)-like protein